MLKEHDAGLLIGDPALVVDRLRYHTFDLAEEWIRLTGKPFVFAFWAVRQAVIEETAESGLIATFQKSRDHGLEPENLRRIAAEWPPKLGITERAVREYLTENIHYHLDAACIEGLLLFYRYAAECKVLSAAPALRFLGAQKPVAV